MQIWMACCTAALKLSACFSPQGCICDTAIPSGMLTVYVLVNRLKFLTSPLFPKHQGEVLQCCHAACTQRVSDCCFWLDQRLRVRNQAATVCSSKFEPQPAHSREPMPARSTPCTVCAGLSTCPQLTTHPTHCIHTSVVWQQLHNKPAAVVAARNTAACRSTQAGCCTTPSEAGLMLTAAAAAATSPAAAAAVDQAAAAASSPAAHA